MGSNIGPSGIVDGSATSVSIIQLPQIAFEEYNRAIEQAEDRRLRLERQIEVLLPNWSLHPVAAAIQALRGVSLIAAVTIIAEVGDFRRFANPRQLMGSLGLVPRERSYGSTRAQGNITKAGNTRARRMLVESAWSYRFPARVAGDLLRRSASLPETARDIAWKAQVRLCAGYRRMAIGAAQECRDGRHRSRTRRLRLGHRHPDTGGSQSRLNINSSTRETPTNFIQAVQCRARRSVRATLDVIRRARLASFETEEGPRRTTVLRYPRIRV